MKLTLSRNDIVEADSNLNDNGPNDSDTLLEVEGFRLGRSMGFGIYIYREKSRNLKGMNI